jgi:hypothetical protein
MYTYGLVRNGNLVVIHTDMWEIIGPLLHIMAIPGDKVIGDIITHMENIGFMEIGEKNKN